MRVISLKASLLVMGLSGIIAQIVLLRELLVSFFGNELTIGIILANWLILEAIGSFFLGKSVEKTKRKIEIYVLLQLIFSAAFPLAIYLARIFKNVLLVTPGEGLGLAPVFYVSLLILSPVSLCHGALFTYGCKLYGQFHQEDASAIGRVYVLETLGAIIGGLLITFLLIEYFNSFEIAFVISLLNTLISLFLLWPGQRAPLIHPQNILSGLSLFLTLFFFYLLLTPHAQNIHSLSIKTQWKGLDVIHYENSIYGNIVITQSGEQITFFTDGIPAITTPFPDIVSLEDLVHFSMLLHEGPKSVLVLSGGAGGMINEILKYPVKEVNYVELDPLLLKLVRQFPTPITEAELTDRRVKIHYTDSRLFVKRTSERFDLIFLGLSSPQELQTNRLFSAEFFSAAKEKMNPRGIMVLSLPGSLTYLSPELRDLNGAILDTLHSVYGHVKIIPGEANLYLASDHEQLVKTSPAEMTRRLAERKVQSHLFSKVYLEYRLGERWLRWFLQGMEGRRPHINSDFQPWGVFFSLSYWSALFSPYLTGMFRWFAGMSLNLYLVLTIILTLCLAAIIIRKPHVAIYSVPYAIFTSGFVNMILDLAIIFTFQTLYGYLYYQIGLLLTIFLAGVALGSHYMTRRLHEIKSDSRLFIITEISVIIFALALPYVFLIPAGQLHRPAVYVLLYGAFLTVSFLCGALIGLQFPLAAKIYLNAPSQRKGFGQTAGLIYGADLMGGFFGGLLGGVLILPVLGLKDACLFTAIIKISSVLLFLLFTRIQR
ncbi:MAG: fused MFS/spermidine synthase [Smithellaceae bacterium]|nr:fused MFS/spermidine synthase [Smithellaceae bacterium]